MRVITFGEILLRLASSGYSRLFQKGSFDATFCGSEANVSVALSNFGLDVSFITKVPDNIVGKSALRSLNYYGVDTGACAFGGKRLGLFFYEKGYSQRASNVLYDRKDSAINEILEDDFNWNNIFSNNTWFHFSGITPALSEDAFNTCLDACINARDNGAIISCDLNYRSQLWSEVQAQICMKKLMKYVDVCIGNEEDANKMLGIRTEQNLESEQIDSKFYENVAREICKDYGCKYVAFSLRNSYNANNNGWKGMIYSYNDDASFYSKEYLVDIIDRLGSGDSFAAGIIYGLINQYELDTCVNFAVAASALKHTIDGDYNLINLEEIKALMKGNTTGRIKR